MARDQLSGHMSQSTGQVRRVCSTFRTEIFMNDHLPCSMSRKLRNVRADRRIRPG